MSLHRDSKSLCAECGVREGHSTHCLTGARLDEDHHEQAALDGIEREVLVAKANEVRSRII